MCDQKVLLDEQTRLCINVEDDDARMINDCLQAAMSEQVQDQGDSES